MKTEITEEWFRRLLRETEPIEAVHTLAQFWSHRLDPSDAQFGLSLPEYHIQLCLIYTGEVGNGGHAQLFDNRGTRHLADTLGALDAVGASGLADVLLRAAGLVREAPGRLVTECVPEATLAAWDAHDREAYALFRESEDALLAYARTHDDILVPERHAA